MANGGYRLLSVSDVYAVEQDRKEFNDAGIDQLAESIKANGLAQPITVRPDGQGRYIVVMGERRFRAHLRAGLAKIKAFVSTCSDEEASMNQLIENVQRIDLNPIEEAEAFQSRLDLFGYTPEQLSTRTGVPVSKIVARVQLLKLGSEAQHLLRTKAIALSTAQLLVGLDSNRERLALRAIADGRLSVIELDLMLQRLRSEQQDQPMFDADEFSLKLDDYVADAQQVNVELHPRQLAQLFDLILTRYSEVAPEIPDDLASLVARAQQTIDYRLKRGEYAPKPKKQKAAA